MTVYILCDVERTTTDIRFVPELLFPYARDNMAQFYKTNPLELERSAEKLQLSKEQVFSTLQDFIARDVKDPELKRIQGLIWQNGYANGTLQGHVYPDVLPAFQRWKQQGIRIGIYSSGSVQAQKLIYGHSMAGDLTSYIDDHFDLAVGFKYERSSYSKIAKDIDQPPAQILFLSDVEAELDAAQEAGMNTIRLFRDAVAETKHAQASDFTEICV